VGGGGRKQNEKTRRFPVRPDTGASHEGQLWPRARRASSQLPLVRRPGVRSQEASGVFLLRSGLQVVFAANARHAPPQQPASHFRCSLHEVR
jgi:hypothetical protein